MEEKKREEKTRINISKMKSIITSTRKREKKRQRGRIRRTKEKKRHEKKH